MMSWKLREKAEDLLSKERGTIYKDPGGKITVVLVYPNKYSVGMSSLGYQGIYGMLNGFSDVLCERAFLPDTEEMKEYERTGTEIFSLESQRALARFDIVAFSVSFENDYPNIIKILEMSRIPSRSAERSSSHPLVIMGGVCAFSNPEPLSAFMDLFFVGEAEEMLPEFLAMMRKGGTRDVLLADALGIEGVYVPKYYMVDYSSGAGLIAGRRALDGAPALIRKRTFGDIESSPVRTVITTPEAEFSEMYLFEAMRGCVWSCRFCLAGRIYKPARKKSLEALKSQIDEVPEGARVGLIGPSLTDYPHAEEVLSIEGVDFSVTSLRASRRSAGIVALMQGHKSVSIAPEAGTQRLRDVINKKITENDILETARLILAGSIETLRLYFMIGLPTETRGDIEGIVALVKRIREDSKRGFITLSVSTFVPKPFTPFQWHPMESLKEVKERLKMIVKGLSAVRGVKVFHDVPKYAYVQGVFSLGDRRVGSMIERAATAGLRCGVSDQDFYVFRKRGVEEILPWDFIDAGVAKEGLWEEYRKAVGS